MRPPQRPEDIPPAWRGPGRSWSVIWGTAARDMRVSLREVMSLIQMISLPLNYLLMMTLFVLAGSNAPTAVVLAGHGPAAQRFLIALEHSRTFRIEVDSPALAAARMRQGLLVGLVTIPAGFDAAVAAGRPVTIPAQINALNQDLGDDEERGLRYAVAQFYASSLPGRLPVTIAEHPYYRRDTGYIPFLSLSIIVIALMVAGLLQAGNNTAREFEAGTFTNVLLSPARPWEVLAGRMLGAYLMSLPAVAIVLAVVVWIVGAHPARLAMTGAVALLTLAVFVAAGTWLGLAVRDRATVATLVRALPVPAFFLSGVFGPLAYQTPVVQAIGGLLPVHYAIVAVQYGFGYVTGALPPGTDALILGGFLALFMILAAGALRRVRREGRRVALRQLATHRLSSGVTT